MRLLILSMPAVALVAVLSVSLQNSLIHSDSKHLEGALPESTRIFERVMERRAESERHNSLLAAQRSSKVSALDNTCPWNCP